MEHTWAGRRYVLPFIQHLHFHFKTPNNTVSVVEGVDTHAANASTPSAALKHVENTVWPTG